MTAWLSRWLVRLGAIGLVAMTAIVAWQVFGRFVLSASPSWTEQAALMLMIWYVMFASAAGIHERFHIRIALLEELLGDRAGPVRRIVSLIVAALGLVLAIYGVQLCISVRGNVIPSLGLSRAVAYFPLPVSGALMTWFALEQTLGREKD
ncbi:TRAP transporter small permease [Aurantiacibacter spongiae]|uniref:TRAP transporter small permease protein n=1 Tax=Aurantiacibacter spongiae TaxID=2488860 RepID=A0A3N5CSM4_9SPHN|nr:TRAP transporter small permease [Aurantiacibacter spongiae]RPF72163.1 TRAP transporter small permease [Aurantiacibacter spongiae]